jgi:hypothetical protein
VLLRILEERKHGSTRIPLVSAIATANPPGDTYYTDPIDPAALDRFAIQLRVDGLIARRDWASVADVVALPSRDLASVFSSAEGAPRGGDGGANESNKRGANESNKRGGGSGESGGFVEPEHSALSDGEAGARAVEFASVRSTARAVVVPMRVQRLLLRVLRVLRDVVGDGGNGHGSDMVANTMSDRAFLVKSLRLMQAQAHVMGRTTAAPEDLHVLVLLSTFRLPLEVRQTVFISTLFAPNPLVVVYGCMC